MRKFPLILIILIFCFIPLFGEDSSHYFLYGDDKTNQELEQELKTAPRGIMKIKILQQLAVRYVNINSIKAIEFDKQALELLKIFPTDNLKLQILNNMCLAYIRLGEYRGAGDCVVQVEDIIKKRNDDRQKAISFLFLGDIYKEFSIYPQALEYMLKALRIFEKTGNKYDIAPALSFTGEVYIEMKDYETALASFIRASEIYSAINQKSGIAFSLREIGDVYRTLGKHTDALIYYSKALKELETVTDKTEVAIVHFHRAKVYSKLGSYHTAIKDELQALESFKKTGKQKDIANALCDLAMNYRKIKAYSKAHDYIQKSLNIARQLNVRDVQRNCYEELANIYECTGDFRKALEFHRKFKELNDTIFTEEDINKSSKIRLKFELEMKEKEKKKEIELLTRTNQLKIERQQLFVYFLIIVILLCLIIASVIYSRLRIGRKTNQVLRDSEQKLKQMNASKDRLFTIISHDLGSPLNSLHLSTDHLEKNYDLLEEEDIREFIHLMWKQTTDMTVLLANLMEWSVSQIGKMYFNPEPIDLQPLTDEVFSHVRTAAEKKNIQLKTDIPESLQIWADNHMIKAVLRNLISNAIKYTRAGGEVKVSGIITSDAIKITVSDNGVGMPKELLEQLFKVEVNESSRGTAGEKGTGLGLLLSKEFVEKNGGHINVESELDHGSQFTITLPPMPSN